MYHKLYVPLYIVLIVVLPFSVKHRLGAFDIAKDYVRISWCKCRCVDLIILLSPLTLVGCSEYSAILTDWLCASCANSTAINLFAGFAF